jgi:hypothetical protein
MARQQKIAREMQQERRTGRADDDGIEDESGIAARGEEVIRRVDQFRDGDDVLVVMAE